VLQGSETVANGTIKATWFAVPGSGTDELSGLRGEGGFEGHLGEGRRLTQFWSGGVPVVDCAYGH